MNKIFCLLIFTTLVQFAQQKTKNALVIHNIKHFDVLFSKMIKIMESVFEKVRVESTANASSKHSTYVYKKPIYDLVVVILPRSNESMNVAEKLELLKFYDDGNNILFLSDSYVVQNWRVLLSQFGFDATTVENTVGGYLGIQTSAESKSFFVDKNSIQHAKLAKGIKKGIIYEGGAISMTPYETFISWSLLEAPETSLFMTQDGGVQIIDKNKMNLLAGAQGTTNKARFALMGSFKMFSNQMDASSDGDNLIFFRNLLSWVTFGTQVLKIQNYSICRASDNVCNEPIYIPNQHGFYIKFQIINEDGEFYVPSEGNLSIKITKQVLHMNVKPDIIQENGESYYYKSFGAIDNGVYKIKIVHDKPGFYLDFKENVKIVNAITTPISKIELFQIEGLPFLILIFVVMISALNLMVLTANRKEEINA